MGERAERLFRKLSTLDHLRELIGTSENSELECKQWSTPLANQGSLAKAACGLANADGGVIIIGMDARGSANEPDVIRALVPVSNTHLVAASAREIIADALEPGIRDVQVSEVPEGEGKISGFVIVYIAAEDGLPQRVRKEGKFFVRMSTGTLPMLYSQIADRFGSRPHASLRVEAPELDFTNSINDSIGFRSVRLSVINVGRGTAHFPALRYRRTGELHHHTGRYGTQPPRWSHFADGVEWFSYRGTANDVIYPGETVSIATLAQQGVATGAPATNQWNQIVQYRDLYFEPVELNVSVVCDGMPEHTQLFVWEEFKHVVTR